MNVIIVGCGKIGTTLLRSLVAEGHNVLGVDVNPDVIARVTDLYDAMGVCGNGADCDTLTEASVEKADLFAAVTASDELNMLSCFLAKRMGAKHTVARIRNPEYNDKGLGFLRQQLGLSISINPEFLTAQEIYNILRLPSAVKMETFSQHRFEMVELRLRDDSPLCGMTLTELRKKYQADFLVGAVQRGEFALIPDGSFALQAGDRIGLTAAHNEIQKLLRMLGIVQKRARSVMILGGGRTSYYLAKLLLAGGNTVKIIEQDASRCEVLATLLPGATILHGDGAQQELLLEEGIRETDAFVSLTGMDEENILISIFAASQNVAKTIAKVNRPELASMAEKLGQDCIVSPKTVTADMIVWYARALQNSRGGVETLYKLMDDKVEAVEFTVSEDFPAVDVPLRELHRKRNVLIAGILRGRKAIIPSGDDRLLVGDQVVVMAAGHRLGDLADILA